MSLRAAHRAATVTLWIVGVLLAAGIDAHAATLALNGDAQYESFGYPASQTAGSSWENFFALTVRGSGRLSGDVTYQLEARVVADDVGYTAGGYSLRNATRRRPYLSLVSGVLSYRPTPALRLSVGKQIVNWSTFDELQAANLMTPRDESDVFRRVEHGVDAVAAHYEAPTVSADLVVVPLAFTPSRLPQGRWQIINETGVEERQDLPPVRLNETQAGARLGTHIGQLDAALVGYVGRDFMAIFVPELIFVGGDQVFLLRIHDHFARLRAGGITATAPLWTDVLLRSEVVYYNSPDRNRDDFLHTAVGIEYGLHDWRVLLNYLRDDQTLNAHEQVTNKGERRFFRSFIFGELRYDAGGRLLARMRGGYDATAKFVILQPEIAYRLWDGLHVALTGDVIQAYRFSYFDAVKHEDRVGMRLEYHFAGTI